MQSLTQLLIISMLSLSVICQYDAAPKPTEPVKQVSKRSSFKIRHEGYVGRGIHGLSVGPHHAPFGNSRRKARDISTSEAPKASPPPPAAPAADYAAPAEAPAPAAPSAPKKPTLEVHEAIYDGLGGNFAAEQADPTSPHVDIAATHPKKSDGGQNEAIYAAGSAETEAPEAAPEAAPTSEKEPEAAPAPEKEPEAAPAPEKEPEAAPAPESAPAAEPEAKKEPAQSQAYRQARLRF